jgi:hypothetical protein
MVRLAEVGRLLKSSDRFQGRQTRHNLLMGDPPDREVNICLLFRP